MDYKVTTGLITMLNGDLRVSPHSEISAFIETGNTDRSAFSRFSLKHVCKDYLLKCITFPVAIG